MDKKLFTPYVIRQREDGLVDILFPSDGKRGECPCHYRLIACPHNGIEEELRRDYYLWKEKARQESMQLIKLICDWEADCSNIARKESHVQHK